MDESLLDQFETWVEAHRAELLIAGAVRFSRGPEHWPRRSAEVAATGAVNVFDLVLWESGEAELGFLFDEAVQLEHADVGVSDELRRLLDRFLGDVRSSAG